MRFKMLPQTEKIGFNYGVGSFESECFALNVG